MTCIIRKINGNKSINYLELTPEEWDLTSQFKVFEDWLRTIDGQLENEEGWIADIGFSPRDSSTGGGPVISKEVMELCLKNKIEIFLSEYDSDA